MTTVTSGQDLRPDSSRTLASLSAPRIYTDLFLVGVLTLFAELALIRWLSAEVRVFAYFKNLTLIACFFGGGLGCLVGSRMRLRRVLFFPMLLALVSLVTLPGLLGWDLITATNVFLGGLNDMPLWTFGRGHIRWLPALSALAFLVVAFLLVTFTFVPAGVLLGDRLQRAPDRLPAYSANVAGSLAGVCLFDAVSYASLPPVAWFAAALLLGLIVLERRRDLSVASLASAGVIVLLVLHALRTAGFTTWSPYQKLSLVPDEATTATGERLLIGYTLQVNSACYQRVANLSPSFLASHPDLFPEWSQQDWLGYNLAYRLKPAPEDVLVVGAGTGNDVAAALRNGAARVDAVEIDPRIVELGRRFHPERPYADPRVRVIIDDARSFLKRTERRYDLIVYGALDSHTLNSALSNLRVDNYVYTREAFAEVRTRLKPGGVLWLLFAVERPHVAERLFSMISAAFGRPPIVFNHGDVARFSPAGGGTTFVIDRDGQLGSLISASRPLAHLIREGLVRPSADVAQATDDWPYLYVKGRTIPQLYLIVMALIVVVALLLVRPHVGHLRSVDPTFFLLGAGFLLLEVQGVSKLALVFGNTWEVAAVVISSILVMILLANLVAARCRGRHLPAAYCGLVLTLLISYLLPTGRLLALPSGVRLIAAGSLVGLPILFSGTVFALTFRAFRSPDLALGSNLLGAIVGGMCESASFVVGLNALALVALAFYVAAGAFQLVARSRSLAHVSA